MASEAGAFGEVLAEQSVGVFVAAALPWAFRVTEGHGDAGIDGEAGVIGELEPAISGQRATQLGGQGGDVRGELVDDMRGRPAAREAHEHHEPGLALDERGDLGVAATDEQVTFPVAGHGPIVGFRRSFADAHRTDDLASAMSSRGVHSRAADRSSTAKVRGQLFA